MNFLARAGFLIIGLFLTSCSKIEVAFDWAPRFMANRLDDNFDFSSERYKKIKNKIADDLQKNKQEIKQGALALLDSLLAISKKTEISTDEIDAVVTNIRASQKKLIQAFGPSFEEVILGLSDKEFFYMKAETVERRKKHEDRLSDFSKYKKKAIDDFEEHFDNYFGTVTKEQTALYERFLSDNFDFFKDQLAFRKSALDEFEKKLPNKPAFLEYAKQYYSGDDAIKSAEQTKKTRLFLGRVTELIQKISISLSAEQRKEFQKNIIEMRDEIQKL